MTEQGVPNLQGMDEQEAHSFLTDLYSRHIPEKEYNARRPKDYVMEMPQSGERFRGSENMRSFQEAHPTPPSSLQVRRVLVKEGLWVVEGVIDYGDRRVFDFVVISELKDGKMWRDRWYFAEPFEAPGLQPWCASIPPFAVPQRLEYAARSPREPCRSPSWLPHR
jgi:hypothetical protein